VESSKLISSLEEGKLLRHSPLFSTSKRVQGLTSYVGMQVCMYSEAENGWLADSGSQCMLHLATIADPSMLHFAKCGDGSMYVVASGPDAGAHLM
jgi:hypothetical protein